MRLLVVKGGEVMGDQTSSVEVLASKIMVVRGKRVMLDTMKSMKRSLRWPLLTISN